MAALGLSAALVGCSERQEAPAGAPAGAHFVDRDSSCGASGCVTTNVRGTLAPPPPPMASGIRSNGPGLPASISRDAYETILTGSRVSIESPMAGAAGPAGLRLRTSFAERDEKLQLVARLPPIPNLEHASQMGAAPELLVRRVLDREGNDLVDHASTFMGEAFRDTPFGSEKPMAMGVAESAEIHVTGFDLPHTPQLLYGSREIALTRSVTLREVHGVEGELTFELPVDVEVVTLRGEAWVLNRDGFELRVERHDDGERLRILVRGATSRFAGYAALSEDGETMEPGGLQGWSRSEGAPETLTVSASFDDPVVAVRVAIAAETMQLRYPFSLTR